MAKSSVKVDASRLSAAVRRFAKDDGLGAFMATEAMAGMEPYVPFRDGDLIKSAHSPRPFKVVYSMPYANRVYYAKGMKIVSGAGAEHPKASKEWDKEWWKHHKRDFCQAVERYIERRLA